MNKKIILNLSIVMLLLLSCQEERRSLGTSYRVVIDQMGREVQVPETIKRIVSLYYITTSASVMLDQQEALVGIENSIGMWGSLYPLVAPELFHLPSVGSLKGINVEEIMKLEPDVVILPFKLKDQVQVLERVGLSVILIDPESPASYEAMILLLGEVFQAQAKAQKLIEYNQSKLAMIQERLADVEPTKRIYLSGSTPFNTAPVGMYQDDLIRLAKGINVAQELSHDYWLTISAEQLVAWDPDIWLMVPYANYTLEELESNPQFQYLDAIQNHQVIPFPSLIEPWDYPTSSSILGLLWLTSLLHPERYSYEEFVADAKYFFLEFYNLDLDASDMGV